MSGASAAQSRREFLAGVASIGAAAALGTPVASAQTRRSPIVLVHGAWHGGWCWQRVVDRLTAKGRTVFAPTLSGVGERSHLAGDSITLTTHIDDIVNEIKWKDLDHLVLVGHSYGGMVITGVPERIRERIAAIAYLDAFIPSDGQSMSSLRSPTAPPLTVPMAAPPSAQAFKVNAKDVDWVNSKVTPHPTKCLTETLHVTDAYQSIREKLYVRTPAFPQPAFDAAYARCRVNREWKTSEMTCGHDLMIDQPAEVATMIDALATR
jgi:pimeloyl-ACP methyl ester carboxylesterase